MSELLFHFRPVSSTLHLGFACFRRHINYIIINHNSSTVTSSSGKGLQSTGIGDPQLTECPGLALYFAA